MADTIKTLNDLDLDIQTEFQAVYEEIEQNEVWFNQLSFSTSTNKDSITERWIQDHAQIKETFKHSGPTYHQMKGLTATIPLQYYEDALEISAFDWKADDTGQTQRRAGDLGKRAAKHPQDLGTAALAAGNTSDDYLLYDGKRMFANDHPKAGTTFDNLLAGAFDSTTLNTAITAMARFFSDLGTADPYGLSADFVIGPPDLKVAFAQVINNSWVPSSSAAIENVQKGIVQSIVDSRLTDTNDWYLATNGLGVSPFIEIRHSDYGNFNLHSEASEDDPGFRDRKMFSWWIYAAMTVFFTRPETMIKVVN